MRSSPAARALREAQSVAAYARRTGCDIDEAAGALAASGGISRRDVLRAGAGLALSAAIPIGAFLMSMRVAYHPPTKKAGVTLLWAVAGFGLVTIVFGLSRWYWLSFLALVFAGGLDLISVIVRRTLVQIVTPDAMRGRVSAVSGLFIGASAELGDFETGAVARLLGPVGAAIVGGIGSLVVTAAWSRMFPALRKADRLDVM